MATNDNPRYDVELIQALDTLTTAIDKLRSRKEELVIEKGALLEEETQLMKTKEYLELTNDKARKSWLAEKTKEALVRIGMMEIDVIRLNARYEQAVFVWRTYRALVGYGYGFAAATLSEVQIGGDDGNS